MFVSFVVIVLVISFDWFVRVCVPFVRCFVHFSFFSIDVSSVGVVTLFRCVSLCFFFLLFLVRVLFCCSFCSFDSVSSDCTAGVFCFFFLFVLV